MSRLGAIPQPQQDDHWLKTCSSKLWLKRLSSRSFKDTTSAKMTRTLLHGGKVPNWLTFTAKHLTPNAAVFPLCLWPTSLTDSRTLHSPDIAYSISQKLDLLLDSWVQTPAALEMKTAICYLPLLLLQHARTQAPGCNVTTMKHHGDIWELPLGACSQPVPVPWHLLSGRTKPNWPGKCLWLGIILL